MHEEIQDMPWEDLSEQRGVAGSGGSVLLVPRVGTIHTSQSIWD